MDGVSYIYFITPGLIIMAVVNNAYSNVVSSFYGARFNLSLQELLVSPLSNHIIILGFVIGGMFRAILVCLLVCCIAYFFGGLAVNNLLLYISVTLICSFLFSLGGLLNGVFSQSFDDITIFPTFILTPLVYLGGTFYSLKLLSEPWLTIASVNPLFYIVDLFRYASLGISETRPLFSFSVIILFCVILYGIILYCLNHGTRLKT
jgi:ABC-2 type transport system permease protein